MVINVFAALLLFRVAGLSACNVLDYGALGDGRRLETKAIQAAIDACAAVLFPPGEYLTGTLFLKSGTTLHIAPGARILGSSKQSDYPRERSRWYVLLAENAENVGITGGGVVDGQASDFVAELNERKNVMVSWNASGACLGDECRPRLIGFVSCRHARLWNLHLRQPAYWSLHIANSSFVSIHDATFFGDFNTPNNDGIDVDGSNHTSISRCRIETADDGIAVKTIAGPLLNLSVTRCWIKSKSSAVKVGSETYFDCSGLEFRDITIADSHRGLAIQLRDAGTISDVVFSKIALSTRFYDPSWWGGAEPVYVTACPRNATTIVGSIRNVTFTDIRAISESGVFIAGWGGERTAQLTLSRVRLQLSRRSDYAGGLHDYRPGCQGLVPYGTTSGVFMQHLTGATLNDVHLSWASDTVDLPLDFAPRSIGRISLVNISSSPEEHNLDVI